MFIKKFKAMGGGGVYSAMWLQQSSSPTVLNRRVHTHYRNAVPILIKAKWKASVREVENWATEIWEDLVRIAGQFAALWWTDEMQRMEQAATQLEHRMEVKQPSWVSPFQFSLYHSIELPVRKRDRCHSNSVATRHVAQKAHYASARWVLV